MKREDIENAAKKEAENLACLVYYGGSAISQEDVENAFVKGAEWRIDSVWHDFDININNHDDVVLLLKNGKIVDYDDDWEEYYSPAVKWAYKKDLLPNTEK
ncbi:hypothetical protein [Prevotella sp.]|jgi:hypothetical protein|nr:hypothetical protein [Prevotella sp.]